MSTKFLALFSSLLTDQDFFSVAHHAVSNRMVKGDLSSR